MFDRAEKLARRLKKSRSELYQEAVAQYLDWHDSDAITEALDRVAAQVNEQPPTFSAVAARRVFERSEW